MAGVVGGPGGRITPQNVPQRTTKVSEKLVLIPDAPDDEDLEDEEGMLEGEDEAARRRLIEQEEDRPLRDVELDVLKKRGGIRGKSYAERLPKRQRAEKVSRLTAYCTAEGFKTKATAEFLRTKHEAKTKLYDDCLYVVYHLPLMSGLEGYRIRSRPILKTPGTGKTVLDLEIERSERRDHHYGYVDDYSGSDIGPTEPSTLQPIASNGSDDSGRDLEHPDDHRPFSPINRLAPDAKNFAEMFVFSYGVVVFWNFTERQEKDILGDLNFAESEKGASLVTRPFDPNDYETEEFHFEYSAQIKHPRIFNDMITLLPRSDHMVKLGISHAVAQSTKLCSFEERMSETMQEALPVPKTMAVTGDLNMGRDEIVKVLGRLFKSRVDINLCEFSSAKNFIQAWVLIHHSLEHPARTQLLLGIRAHSRPTLHRHSRLSRDRSAHQSAQRALPRLSGPRRDPLRHGGRRQDVRHHLDCHCAHRYLDHRHCHRSRPALRHPTEEQDRQRHERRTKCVRWGGLGGQCSTGRWQCGGGV